MKTTALLLALVLAASQQVASASYWVDTHANSKGNPYWSGLVLWPANNNKPPCTPKPAAYVPAPATGKPCNVPKPATSNHNNNHNGNIPLTFNPSGWDGYIPGDVAPPTKSNAPVPAAPSKPPAVPMSKPTAVPATSEPAPTPSRTPKPTKTPKPAKPTKIPKPTDELQDDGSSDIDDTTESNDTSETPAPATPAPTLKPASPGVTAPTPTTTVVPAITPQPTLATLSPTVTPTVVPTMIPTVVPTPVPTTAAPTPVPTTAAPTPVPTTAAPTPPPTTAAPIPEPTTAAPTPKPVPVSTLPASNWPTATDVVQLAAPHVIAAGEVFDGAMKKYERSNVLCDEGKELVGNDAVFIIQAGGTLKNAIIGGNQVTGVFCAENKCALDNVWSEDVCQAALVVATGAGTTTVTGGGAKGATARVILAKSAGTVTVSGGFYLDNCGALFESCATCGPVKRQVIVDGVVVVNPTAELVRVNRNYKDEAVIVSAKIITTTAAADYKVCTYYDGGKVPLLIGSGVEGTLCQYTTTGVSVVSSY